MNIPEELLSEHSMRDSDHSLSSDDRATACPTGQSRRSVLRASAAAGLGAVSLWSPSPVAADPPDVDPENFHIYLLFGQSNMEGQGDIAPQDRETNPRVHVLQDADCPDLGREYGNWYLAEPPLNRCWAGVGPGDYFGKTMAAEMPEDVHIGMTSAAVSGAEIALWEKGAPIGNNGRDIPMGFDGAYEWLLDLAQRAQEVGTIKGILFHQGESDAGDEDWKHTVAGIVEDLKADLGIGDVPFLAGEMVYGVCCEFHNEEVAQLPDVISNAHVVSTEGLGNQDQYHFDTEGYRELGRRYAEEMLEHVDAESTCEPTPITPYVEAPQGQLETDAVTVTSGESVDLTPEVAEGGTWTWDGVDADSSIATVSPTETTAYTATFTNNCGATSSVEFTVTVEDDADCPGDTTDPDGDGLCEDINGNGRGDSDDVVQFFSGFEDDLYQGDPGTFDFNESGSIGFDDVVALFNLI